MYQGESDSSFFYIEEGYIRVYDITASETEKIIMILGPGDIFPLVWSAKNEDHALHYFYESYTAVSVHAVTKKELLQSIEKDNEVTKYLLYYFNQRTKELMARLDCIEATSARHKIAQVLRYLADAHGRPKAKLWTEVLPPTTHQVIADMAGVTRETASLQLKELVAHKIIKTEVNKPLIINREKLTAFIRGELD